MAFVCYGSKRDEFDRDYMSRVFALVALATSLAILPAQSQSLVTSFDESGLTLLSYNNTSLVDLKAKRGDPFLVGSYQWGGQQGYGGAEKKSSWNAGTRTLTWTLRWGSVECQFVPDPARARLDLKIAVHNASPDSLTSINLYPLGLQFPELPKSFGAANYPQFHNNLDGPALIVADYRTAALAIAETAAKPLYVGLAPSGAANHYALQVGTANDNSTGFLAKAVPLSRPVPAGQTDHYFVSLRFGASGASAESLAPDVLETYRRAWPLALAWKDRRPIGELFLSDPTSSPIPDSADNPRHYNFVKGAPFRQALLAYADRAVRLLKTAGAQGALVWDLEGQQYPQPDTSYAGDPVHLKKLAPEMDAVADEFFKRFTSNGLHCGVTLRPQELDFTVAPPRQHDLPASGQIANLVAKIRYAKGRWGCDMFYVDSNGGPNDASAPSVFAAVLKEVPGILLIPENIWTQDYAYTAPLASFTAPYKPLHTPSLAHAIWPGAFSVTYVGDVPGGDLHADPERWKQFSEAVHHGDILAFRAWFDDQPLNGQVRELTGH